MISSQSLSPKVTSKMDVLLDLSAVYKIVADHYKNAAGETRESVRVMYIVNSIGDQDYSTLYIKFTDMLRLLSPSGDKVQFEAKNDGNYFSYSIIEITI